MLEDRLHNFDDIVFSCFLPDDWLNEFRMPQHVLVYVYAGFLNKTNIYDTSYHADRLVESATQAVTEELFRDFGNTLRILCDEDVQQ